jgi:hypothetical protein
MHFLHWFATGSLGVFKDCAHSLTGRQWMQFVHQNAHQVVCSVQLEHAARYFDVSDQVMF